MVRFHQETKKKNRFEGSAWQMDIHTYRQTELMTKNNKTPLDAEINNMSRNQSWWHYYNVKLLPCILCTKYNQTINSEHDAKQLHKQNGKTNKKQKSYLEMLQSAGEHPQFCCFACSSSPRLAVSCHQTQTKRTFHSDGKRSLEPSCRAQSLTENHDHHQQESTISNYPTRNNI